jgi:hypothetical protein
LLIEKTDQQSTIVNRQFPAAAIKKAGPPLFVYPGSPANLWIVDC